MFLKIFSSSYLVTRKIRAAEGNFKRSRALGIPAVRAYIRILGFISRKQHGRWDCAFLETPRFSLAGSLSSSSPSSFFSGLQSPVHRAQLATTDGRTDVLQCEVRRGSVYVRYSMPYAIWLMASALLSVIDSTSRTRWCPCLLIFVELR